MAKGGINLKIYFSCDSPLIEKEIRAKGWRDDILIEIHGNYYTIEFLTLDRLIGEFENSIESNENYIISNTTIIVDDISKDSIINHITLLDLDFFEDQTPLKLDKQYRLAFKELQNIDNWIEVYSD